MFEAPCLFVFLLSFPDFTPYLCSVSSASTLCGFPPNTSLLIPQASSLSYPSPPSLLSYDSLHLKSIIKLASRCDRSLEESYWEHFPASLSRHRETRLTSQNQDGSSEIRRIPEAYPGLCCCSESFFSFYIH